MVPLLQEERGECQNLRDMLIRAQRDIENLRQGVSEQMTSQAGEVSKRDKDKPITPTAAAGQVATMGRATR